jgi:hypothetical protein
MNGGSLPAGRRFYGARRPFYGAWESGRKIERRGDLVNFGTVAGVLGSHHGAHFGKRMFWQTNEGQMNAGGMIGAVPVIV